MIAPSPWAVDGGSGWMGVGDALGRLPGGLGLVTNRFGKTGGIELSSVAARELSSAWV